MGFFDGLFGGGSTDASAAAGAGGGGFSWGSLAGPLIISSLGALSQYGSLKGQKEQQGLANKLAQDKFAEDKRQFDLNYALAQQKLAQGGGGGGGGGDAAALALARQKALADAYNLAASGSLKGSDQVANNYLAVANLLTKPLLSR